MFSKRPVSFIYPEWSYLTELKVKEERYRDNQKHNYDHRHTTKYLPELPDDTCVWVETLNKQIPMWIISARPEPRSYRKNDKKIKNLKVNRGQSDSLYSNKSKETWRKILALASTKDSGKR